MIKCILISLHAGKIYTQFFQSAGINILVSQLSI